MFFAKRVHLFIGEGGKGKGHLREPRDRRGRGIWGCGGTSSSSAGVGVKASPREPLGRPPSISSKKAVSRQQSTVGSQRSTVAMVDCRSQGCRPTGVSTVISASGRPSEAIGRPLSGQRSTACRLLQAILPNMLQMSQMTQENRKSDSIK